MTRENRWRALLAVLLAALMVGCGAGEPANDPPAKAPATADMELPEQDAPQSAPEQNTPTEEQLERYDQLLKEEHDDQWAPVADCGDLLSLPEGTTPEAYFEGIQEQAEEQAGLYISQRYLPWAERFQQNNGGKTAASSYFADYRIDALVPGGVYLRDGTPYLVYTLTFSLLPTEGTELGLYDGMGVGEDGWLVLGPDTVLALTAESDEPLLYFGTQSDIFPDNAEHFPEGFRMLLAQKQAGLLTADAE